MALCSGGFRVRRKAKEGGTQLAVCDSDGAGRWPCQEAGERAGTQPEQEFVRESDHANVSPSPRVLGSLGEGGNDIPQNLVWGLVLFKGNMIQEG